jgi:hypothetical protein
MKMHELCYNVLAISVISCIIGLKTGAPFPICTASVGETIRRETVNRKLVAIKEAV